MKARYNLRIARENTNQLFEKDLKESNKLWQGVIRLIITLSSSYLLLTLALAEKLFPKLKNVQEWSLFLISAWILFFLAIIFGLVAELNETIFRGNMGRKRSKFLQEIDRKLAQGLEEDEIELPEKYFENGSIVWGACAADFFVVAILCLCLAFLEKIISSCVCVVILIIGLFLLFGLNKYLLDKREK